MQMEMIAQMELAEAQEREKQEKEKLAKGIWMFLYECVVEKSSLFASQSLKLRLLTSMFAVV